MKNRSLKKIGGEFEINPSSLNGISDYKPNKDLFLYSSGRIALMAILKNIARTNPTRIHVPYYICYSVINACSFEGFEVSFYELDAEFLFPFEYSLNINKGEALLTVNYFGFVDDNPIIQRIKETRPDIITISDQTQSFWTCEQSIADYSFTSLRKHFPVPDGAFVHTQKNLLPNEPSIPVNSFYHAKFMGSILKFFKHEDKLYLDFFEEGESILDIDRNVTRASLVTNFIFAHINIEYIKQRRKNNTKIIYELGKKAGLQFVFEYNANVVPLNVPILLDNRDEIRSALMKESIFLPIHWIVNNYNLKSNISYKMSSYSMSLIVDQRYGSNEMNLQANIITYLTR